MDMTLFGIARYDYNSAQMTKFIFGSRSRAVTMANSLADQYRNYGFEVIELSNVPVHIKPAKRFRG